MAKVQSSIQIQTPTAAPLTLALPDSEGGTTGTQSLRTGFKKDGPDATAPHASEKPHGLFKWFGKLYEIKEAIERAPALAREEAEGHAARGDYERALEVGLQLRGGLRKDLRRYSTPQEIAFDLKLADWAKKSRNLIAAYEILRPAPKPYALNVRDEARQKAFLELVEHPELWIQAASHQKENGDYPAALEHLRLAERFALTQSRFPRPGEWQVFRTEDKTTVDAEMVKRIKDEALAVNRQVETLPGLVQQLYPKIHEAMAPKLAFLSSLQVPHADLSSLASQARTRFLAGFLHRNQRLLDDANSLAVQIERYTKLEPVKTEAFELLSSLRPRNSRFAFELRPETVTGDVETFEASPDAVRNDPVMKAYEDISRKNPALARQIFEIYEDMKKSLTREEAPAFNEGRYNPYLPSYDPVRDRAMFQDFREEPVADVQQLTALNDRLAKLYEGPAIKEFLKEVDLHRPAPKADEIGESLETLPVLSKILEKTASPDCRDVTWAQIKLIKSFMIERLEKHDRYFLNKRKALKAEEDKYLHDSDHEGMARVTHKFDRLQREFRPAAGAIDRVKSLPVNDVSKALTLLKEIGPSVLDAEERYLRANLLDKIESLPTGRKEFEKDLNDIGHAEISRSDPGAIAGQDKAERYTRLNSAVSEKGIDAFVSESISELQIQRSKAHRAETAERFIPFHESGPRSDPFSEMILGLKIARGMIRSDDPETRARGYEALKQFASASVNKAILSKVKSSQWFDKYIVNPGVMLVASAAMVTAARFVGPVASRLLGRTAAAPVAFWTGTASFNASTRLLYAWNDGKGVVNEIKDMAKHPVDTAAGIWLDGMMMKFLHLFSGRIGKFAESRFGLKGWKLKMVYPADLGATLGGLHAWNRGVMSFYRNLRHDKGSLSNVVRDFTHPDFFHEGVFVATLEGAAYFLFKATKNFDGVGDLGIKVAGLDKARLRLEEEIADVSQSLGAKPQDRKTALDLTLRLEGLLKKYRKHLEKTPEGQKNHRAYLLDPEKNAQFLSAVREFKQKLLIPASPANDNAVPGAVNHNGLPRATTN